MRVGATYQVGELGHLDDLPARRAKKLCTLAVHEQVGLAPREHDPRDRGCEDEFGAASGSGSAGAAGFERAVERGVPEPGVAGGELG